MNALSPLPGRSRSSWAPLFLSCTLGSVLALGTACGPRTSQEAAREAREATEIVVEGGATQLQARLSFLSPEAMAIQEVPFDPRADGWNRLQQALGRYRRQWTLLLSIGPGPRARIDPQNPLAHDIENNGGLWHDHSRNLQRLMFEMAPFIRLRLADGTEIEPSLVEFQRSFGMGRDRSFLITFPKTHQGKYLRPPFEVRVGEFGQGMGSLEFPVKAIPGDLSGRQVKRMWMATSGK